MIAEKAKVENKDTCPICLVEDNLKHYYEPEQNNICSPCFLKLCPPLTFDEYDLRPDELTIEMVAELAGKTTRAVQKWQTAKLIGFEVAERRNPKTNQVRELTIFKKTDIDEFLNNRRKGKQSYKIDKVTIEETAALQPSEMNNQVMNAFAMMFESINAKLDQTPKLSPLAQITGKMFLDIDETARACGIGKTKLLKAIHEAEKTGLQRFPGERGKAVWKCEDLQKIIESIPPAPISKRLPPPKKKKE